MGRFDSEDKRIQQGMKRQFRAIKVSIFKQSEASRFIDQPIHPHWADLALVAFHTDFVVACKRFLSIHWYEPSR
jgi:hypothetical protein